MSSFPVRNPDHLLTPSNSALLIIDYQPLQIQTVKSMDHQKLIQNMGFVIDLAKLFQVPIVLSSVNVRLGQKPTVPELRNRMSDALEIDRTSINAWEDQEFYEAVRATGRKKLIMTALWTEACLAFPTLDALKEGYEVYPVVDAVGGTSEKAHEAALSRVMQAGASPISVAQLACELQRDWNRSETKKEFTRILMAIEEA